MKKKGIEKWGMEIRMGGGSNLLRERGRRVRDYSHNRSRKSWDFGVEEGSRWISAGIR